MSKFHPSSFLGSGCESEVMRGIDIFVVRSRCSTWVQNSRAPYPGLCVGFADPWNPWGHMWMLAPTAYRKGIPSNGCCMMPLLLVTYQ